ncbi:hypothetical protein [Nostoc sp. JL33]|nr:hypothetical protein [Nostoc sp. JL33]
MTELIFFKLDITTEIAHSYKPLCVYDSRQSLSCNMLPYSDRIP